MIEGSFGRDLNGQGEPQTTDASGNYVLSLYAPATPIPGVYVAIAGLNFSASYSSLRPTNENAFYFLKQGATGAGPYMASLTPNEMYTTRK